MFAPDPVLLDPEPMLGRRGLLGLDWDTSWDCTSTATTDADWDAPDGVDLDLDAELRDLLDSVRRNEPADDAVDPELAAVLAILAERTEVALAVEAAEAAASLTCWSDAALVAEAARLETTHPLGDRPRL